MPVQIIIIVFKMVQITVIVLVRSFYHVYHYFVSPFLKTRTRFLRLYNVYNDVHNIIHITLYTLYYTHYIMYIITVSI